MFRTSGGVGTSVQRFGVQAVGSRVKGLLMEGLRVGGRGFRF